MDNIHIQRNQDQLYEFKTLIEKILVQFSIIYKLCICKGEVVVPETSDHDIDIDLYDEETDRLLNVSDIFTWNLRNKYLRTSFL